MDPKVWGPQFWFMMHSTSFGYPDNPSHSDKKHYKKFYKSLQDVLPCETCRGNYAKHLKEVPITDEVLKSKKNLFLWTVKIHNKVNKDSGKKNIDPSYILKKYEKLYGTSIKL